MSSYTSFNTLLLSPFWLVAVLVCRCFACRHFSLSPFWSGQSVALLVSPFWRVAVLVCRRFDHTPWNYLINYWIIGSRLTSSTLLLSSCSQLSMLTRWHLSSHQHNKLTQMNLRHGSAHLISVQWSPERQNAQIKQNYLTRMALGRVHTYATVSLSLSLSVLTAIFQVNLG